jgi:hypothetical protein
LISSYLNLKLICYTKLYLIIKKIMRLFPIWLIAFWTILIIFPELVGYLLWWFLIFIWINILIFFRWKSWKWKEDYVKFGKYKIYR